MGKTKAKESVSGRLEWVEAGSLNRNPSNWRRHPQSQLNAIRDSLTRLGWLRPLTYNATTGRLVDGHARLEVLNQKDVVPVFVVELSEADERRALLSLDPMAELAQVDEGMLHDLLEAMPPDDGLDPTIDALLRQFSEASPEPLTFEDPPRSVEENARHLDEIKRQRSKGNENVVAKADTERFLVIVYATRADRERAVVAMGLPADERYVAGDSVRIRARANAAQPVSSEDRPAQAGPANKTGATG